MKCLAVITSLIAAAAAQSVSIVSPAPGARLTHGTSITTTIASSSSGTTVQSVSIVISLLACPSNSCPNAATDLGTVLFAGPFAPTGSPPQQSFNVTIPSTFAAGSAEFLATHFGLSGPATGPAAFVQIDGEVVTVR